MDIGIRLRSVIIQLLGFALASYLTACGLAPSSAPATLPSLELLPSVGTANLSGWPSRWPTLPVYPRSRGAEVQIKDAQTKLAPDYVEVITIRRVTFQSTDPAGDVLAYYEAALPNLAWAKVGEEKWQRCLVSEYERTNLSLFMHVTSDGKGATEAEIIVQALPGERCR